MTTKPYTVLMLYPDYLAENYGEDTYIAHVDAHTLRDAQDLAQEEALRMSGADPEGADPEDFLVLAVFPGHHNDLKVLR